MIQKINTLNRLLVVALLVIIFQAGCTTTTVKETSQLPTEAVETTSPVSAPDSVTGLSEITGSNQIPGFRDDYGRIELLYAVDNSREYFKKVESYPDTFKSIGFTPEKQIETLNLFRDGYVGSKSPQELSEFIAKNFRIFQANGKGSNGTVQFTGYGFAVFGDDVKRKWDHTVYKSSIGFPATQMRSIATGEGLFPPGGLGFVVIETGEKAGKAFFVLGHDTKSEIKTADRVDVFHGIGKEALHKAENFNASGNLYYLLKR
jgi:membrane-bound lytic murein transglycosylase